MQVILKKNQCVITRADSDTKFYSESVFLHHVKIELQKQGHDVVKKLMWKDGHLVADTQHYIRDRKWKFAIYDTQYAIRPCFEPFNRDGRVSLAVERWEVE